MRIASLVLYGLALSVSVAYPSSVQAQRNVPSLSAEIDASERASIIESLLRIRGGGVDHSAPVDTCSLAKVLTDGQRRVGVLPDLSWLLHKPVKGTSCSARTSSDYRDLSRRIYLISIERDTTVGASALTVVTAQYMNDEYSHEERYFLRPLDSRSIPRQWGLVEIRQSKFIQMDVVR